VAPDDAGAGELVEASRGPSPGVAIKEPLAIDLRLTCNAIRQIAVRFRSSIPFRPAGDACQQVGVSVNTRSLG